MLVLIGLCRYADKEGGNCYPALGRLAYEVGYSRRQIISIVKQLRDKQILIEVGKMKAGNVIYKIEIGNVPSKESYKWVQERKRRDED